MSYLKGKDIKVPFDCLWYYYTRKFEATIFRPMFGHSMNNGNEIVDIGYIDDLDKPDEFEKW